MSHPAPSQQTSPSRFAGLLACVAVAGLVLGCDRVGGGGDPATTRAEVQATLDAYLPKLAQAYASRDATLLADVAVPKEVASVDKLIRDLAEQGRILRPELRQVTVEEVQVWNYSNAVATTLEVWDLEVVAAGSEVRISQSLGQRNRVKYQLERRDGDDAWQVLWRTIDQTLEP